MRKGRRQLPWRRNVLLPIPFTAAEVRYATIIDVLGFAEAVEREAHVVVLPLDNPAIRRLAEAARNGPAVIVLHETDEA